MMCCLNTPIKVLREGGWERKERECLSTTHTTALACGLPMSKDKPKVGKLCSWRYFFPIMFWRNLGYEFELADYWSLSNSVVQLIQMVRLAQDGRPPVDNL